ncbi:MarR family winged helix-turn-helix transcriptional regulator [Pseudonocardia sp. KRD291]|uniref:MarR family winged helix-turn-helix transcriptional regulator n=1 Tax=Pseudonocardia sp. KRD291 TaxID=2792007 RepID=UPI001C49EC4F|nr:MarR family winged helix-turn-helix transcriptional regulator [Pseudonocardia sp. KRD291]MBW0104533.1 winged helix-turn-helix transcriptional regulator [Pseudonocardia sp. KRD291]
MQDADGGPALFRLVRFWSRRWARGVAVGGAGETTLVQDVLTVNAVATCVADDREGATVGDVGRQLGIDQSGASRMVAGAVERGYVERRRASSDARRAVLGMTSAGRELIASSEQWQRGVFDELTFGWDAEDRERFAAYLQRLARQVGA